MTGDLSGFAGRRVLVTGATGFIGAHLCRRLVDIGTEVHGVSRHPRSSVKGLRWWHGHLADPAFTSEVVREVAPDVVFHLAAHVDGARDLAQVQLTLQGNLITTVNLLTSVTETGCDRIVLLGSLDEPGPEEVAEVPGSPYAASKWACSDYARMFHALFDLPVVIGRTFMVYGPGQGDHRKLIPYVVRALLREEQPRLSKGTRPVDWVYVDDVVNGLLRLSVAPDVGGQSIDLGCGNLVQVREVVLRLVDIIRPKVEVSFGALPERPLEQVRAANLADTKARIGWEPTIPLDEGLERTVAWYAEHS